MVSAQAGDAHGHGDDERLRHHEPQDRRVREAHRFHHGELAGPLANPLGVRRQLVGVAVDPLIVGAGMAAEALDGEHQQPRGTIGARGVPRAGAPDALDTCRQAGHDAGRVPLAAEQAGRVVDPQLIPRGVVVRQPRVFQGRPGRGSRGRPIAK